MRHAGRPVAILLLLSAALACAPPGSTAQLKEDLPHPKSVEELKKAMKDVLDKEHVPGAGIALIANGEALWCGGIGKADTAANFAVSCDTEFRVGSISKTFVALALLKLQEEGKINLYARLQDVAPEIPFKNRWEATHPVRIVNLLEHAAKNAFRGDKEPEGTIIFFASEFGDRAIAGSGLEGIPYSERNSLIMPLIRIALLSLCLFFMLTSLPFALVWLFLKLVGAMKDVHHLSVRVAPLLTTLAFWIVPLCFLNLNGSQIGTFKRWTAGI